MEQFGAEVRLIAIGKKLLANRKLFSRIEWGNHPGVVDRHLLVLVIEPEFHQHGTVTCELQLIKLVGEVELNSRWC